MSKKRYSLVFFSLVLILTVASGIVPINDYDFFWHLKTGEWIWQNKSLPDKDPFAFTTLSVEQDEPHRPRTILTSYWLSQLFFYGLYSLSGFKGIIVFRVIIFCVILFVLWWRMKKNGVDNMLIILFSIPYVIIAREYQTERPQLFSFLFAGIALYLLEDLKQGRRAVSLGDSPRREEQKSRSNYATVLLRYCALPLIMLLWANMHGGFLVGSAFILVYLIAEWLAYLLPARHILNDTPQKQAPLRFTLIAVGALISGFLNPNTYHTIISFFGMYENFLHQVTLEFISPLRLYNELNSNWYAFWFMLGISILIIIFRFKELDFAELFILVGTIIASLAAVRYVFFFFIASIPIIARHAGILITRISQSMSALLKFYSLRIVPYSLVILLLLLIYRAPTWGNIRLSDAVSPEWFPLGAISFVEKYEPPGPIFNYANWGGYLTWKLYPGYKVFIDTRTLNIEIFKQYFSIINANQNLYLGMPEWKGILSSYGINLILTPLIDRYSGEILPLTRELMKDDEWALVHIDGYSTIFMRVTSSKKDFIKAHYFDKRMLWYEISMEARRGVRHYPDKEMFYRTLQEADMNWRAYSDEQIFRRPLNSLIYK